MMRPDTRFLGETVPERQEFQGNLEVTKP